MFFQCLCETGVGWDTPLTGDLLREWSRLLSSLKGPESLVIPRCYFSGAPDCPRSVRLIGFCDASTKAYAAVVYLRIEGETQICVRFVAAKTRVAPLGGVTIPRVELLSTLLLSNLIASVQVALQTEVMIGDPACYTDSRVALYWIRGCNQEWKQFVENRLTSICASVPPRCWEHCPGKENPADIPSRGMTASELLRRRLWLSGPDWLSTCQDLPDEDSDTNTGVPEGNEVQEGGSHLGCRSRACPTPGTTDTLRKLQFSSPTPTSNCTCIKVCTPSSSEGEESSV